MINDKLAIVLYTSTKGHFGYKDCYKHTVERMEKEIPFFNSFTKVAHIKYSKKDGEDQLVEMETFLNNKGFVVEITKGEWGHNNESHANGYYRDMLTTLSKTCLHKYPYVFVVEDDWQLSFNGLFSSAVSEALSFLDKDLDALCVRVNRDTHDDTHMADHTDFKLIFRQGEDYTPYGPTFTFQPTIVRLKEWYHSVRVICKAIDADPELFKKTHCELISGQVLKQFSDSDCPFYFFDPEVINAKHIGEEEEIKKL